MSEKDWRNISFLRVHGVLPKYDLFANNCGDFAVSALNAFDLLQSVDTTDAWRPAEYRDELREEMESSSDGATAGTGAPIAEERREPSR